MFFNVWSSKIYSISFLFNIILLFISLVLITYIIIQAVKKYLKITAYNKNIKHTIEILNENNYKDILNKLGFNSSYKLKLIWINPNNINIEELKNLLLKYYLWKKKN